MEKRSCKRMNKTLPASISCEPYRYEARIVNISEKGVCIHTAMCFPIGTECRIFILVKDRMLEVNAIVKHISREVGIADAMGFELLNPSADYIAFAKSLRSSL